MFFYHSEKKQPGCSDGGHGPDGALTNCSLTTVNEEGAIGLSGAPIWWKCCLNVDNSKFSIEMQMGYVRFIGNAASK